MCTLSDRKEIVKELKEIRKDLKHIGEMEHEGFKCEMFLQWKVSRIYVD